jgi:hypothetical protein
MDHLHHDIGRVAFFEHFVKPGADVSALSSANLYILLDNMRVIHRAQYINFRLETLQVVFRQRFPVNHFDGSLLPSFLITFFKLIATIVNIVKPCLLPS